jgi:hypothetical protein
MRIKQAVKLLALAGFITLSLAASTEPSQRMNAVKQRLAEKNSHFSQKRALKPLEDMVPEPTVLAQVSSQQPPAGAGRPENAGAPPAGGPAAPVAVGPAASERSNESGASRENEIERRPRRDDCDDCGCNKCECRDCDIDVSKFCSHCNPSAEHCCADDLDLGDVNLGANPITQTNLEFQANQAVSI